MTLEKINLEGLVSGDELKSIYKKRNQKYQYKTVIAENAQTFIEQGWEKTKHRGRKKIRLRKLKNIGDRFEDETWCIFYRMGFKEMNKDNTFIIPRYDTTLTKQIDVFAKDEQCIICVDCKEAENPHSKRQLDTDIDALANIKLDLEKSIYSHYRKEKEYKKLKVIWILALKNIDITDPDLQRAKKANIHVLDGKDIDYYNQFTSHFGPCSKYQFLADVLPGKGVPGLFDPIPAIKGSMGGKEFYSFVIEPEKLMQISYIAHRLKTNEETVYTYQRLARKRRLKKIAEYITNQKGIFPTSIVINIESSRGVEFKPSKDMSGKNAVLGTLYLPNKYKTAWIVDGQHRLFAYSGLKEAETATLPVIAFVNLEPERQAQMFVNINGEQVKVKKSLLIDLQADIHLYSENPELQLYSLTSRLVRELDTKSSPFRDRIVYPDCANTETCNITYNTLAEEFRKNKFIGTTLSKNAKDITPGPLYYQDNENTLIRAKNIIIGYFLNYIENEEDRENTTLKKQWNVGRGEGGYICTNAGVRVLLRILKEILEYLVKEENIKVEKLSNKELLEKIWKYQKPVYSFLSTASPSVLKEYRQRSSSEQDVYFSKMELLWEINKVYPNFEPEGLTQHKSESKPEKKTQAFEIFSDIERKLIDHVVKILKNRFGDNYNQWWLEGTPDPVQKDEYKKAIEKKNFGHPEENLDFINLRDIMLHNFNLFGEQFTIDGTPNDGKKKRLEWLVKINEIRNKKIAHYGGSRISDTELDYLKHIKEEIDKIIPNSR